MRANHLFQKGKDYIIQNDETKESNPVNWDNLNKVNERGDNFNYYSLEIIYNWNPVLSNLSTFINNRSKGNEDLKKYRAIERNPVIGDYRGNKVYSIGPPSSGGVTLVSMLNVLENIDLKLFLDTHPFIPRDVIMPLDPKPSMVIEHAHRTCSSNMLIEHRLRT